MNYIDIVILVVLGIFGLGGLRKGIITEAATLLGLGVGLYGAFHFSDFTAEKLVQWVEINPKYRMSSLLSSPSSYWPLRSTYWVVW